MPQSDPTGLQRSSLHADPPALPCRGHPTGGAHESLRRATGRAAAREPPPALPHVARWLRVRKEWPTEGTPKGAARERLCAHPAANRRPIAPGAPATRRRAKRARAPRRSSGKRRDSDLRHSPREPRVGHVPGPCGVPPGPQSLQRGPNLASACLQHAPGAARGARPLLISPLAQQCPRRRALFSRAPAPRLAAPALRPGPTSELRRSKPRAPGRRVRPHGAAPAQGGWGSGPHLALGVRGRRERRHRGARRRQQRERA